MDYYLFGQFAEAWVPDLGDIQAPLSMILSTACATVMGVGMASGILLGAVQRAIARATDT